MRSWKTGATLPFVLMLALLISGPLTGTDTLQAAEKTTAAKKANVYKGKVLGVSKKAKTISIKAGKKTEMVKYDDSTIGIEHAKKGHASIIHFEMRGGNKMATVIKPKLAKLPKGVTEMKVDELAKLVAKGPLKGNYYLVDSRPAKRYDQAHIPTAVSIPMPKLKEKGKSLLPADLKDKNTLLIFYCGGLTCGLSTKSAGMAKKMGFANIQVMLQGEPGWGKSGRPLYASMKFVNKGNIVLVDLRKSKKVKKGHIPRAVNIPVKDLEDAEDDFPSNMSAPIVLYGKGNSAEKAAKTIKKWGYKKVSLVDGGLKGWITAGFKAAKGPAGDEIDWVRKLGKGEVSIAEFEKAAKGSATQVILDVRNKDEVEGGGFANSVHIPLDQIETRMKKLSKGKEYLVHCTTGARAEMAWQALKKAGYKARFCVADIECEGGECHVSE